MLRLNRLIALLFVLISSICGHAQTDAPKGFNSVPNDDMLDFFDRRPVPPHAFRVLYVGDSLTFHSPAPGIWTYYSGMAASDTEHDFVHITAAHFQKKIRRPVEIFYSHGGGKIGAMLAFVKDRTWLAPDLIILQGGENDPFDDTFYANYRGLLEVFPNTPRIVLSDWKNPIKRDYEREEAAKRHLPFVDMIAIQADPHTAGNAGPFHHQGVAWHPNDEGMKRIAAEINRTFDTMHMR
jgi:hypothetical protein